MVNWAAGDMGVCISNGNWHFGDGRTPPEGPRIGQLITVRGVGFDGNGVQGLWLDGFPGNEYCDGFEARHFMRIPPEKLNDENEQIKELENAT